MLRIFYIGLFLFIGVNCVNSQNIIHGIIKDAETEKPLPYTNIYIEKTYIGTTSNQNGHYSLKIPAIPSTIIVSYIGYETRIIVVNQQSENQLDIFLKPIVLELGSVKIAADQEDPAIGIMKKVIANKIKWRKKLKSYKAKAYTRYIIKNDSSIVSMSESVSNLYWNLERGSLEEFIARKSSKRMPYLTELAVGSKNIINFFDDNIPLLNYNFVGPIHPDALDYYNFKLIGERAFNNKIVYDIQVIPKSRLQPLFSGQIAVLDDDYAMIEVDLKNSGNMSFSEMLEYFCGSYKQQFSNFGKEFWLPIDSRIEESFEVDMGILAFPKAISNKISRISNYEVNVNLLDDFVRIDTTSPQISSGLLNNNKAFNDFEKVPLTELEQKAFSNPDTTKTLVTSFRPTGLLAPYFISNGDEIETALSEHGSYSTFQSSTHYGFQAWYNRVEGLSIGIKLKHNFINNFQVAAIVGYQTFAKKFYYDTQLKFLINKKIKDRYFYIGYYNKTDMRYLSEHYSQMVASFLPIWGTYDYFDYFSNKKFYTGFKYQMKKLNSNILIKLNSEDHLSIQSKSDWNLFKRDYTQRKNPAIDEGRLNSIKLEYKYDESIGIPEIAKTGLFSFNKFELQVEHSSAKYLNSDFDFTQYSFLYDYTLKTFFRRRADCNSLRTRLEMSTYSGELPLQKFYIIDGRFFSYSPFGIFKTHVNKPLEGQKKLAFFWEYNFKSIPFEFFRLNYFARLKYEFLIHGALGRTWINMNTLQDISKNYIPSYLNEYHKELGLSIRLKYRFVAIKLDATRNLNHKSNYISFSLNLIGMSF